MQQNNPAETTEVIPSHQSWKTWLIVAASVVGGFVIINALIWVVYLGRAYPGVKLGAQKVGNLTTSSIRTNISQTAGDYKLTIQVQGQPKVITPSDIDLTYDVPVSAKAAVDQGKQFWIPLYGLVYSWQNGATPITFQVDEAKLGQLVTTMAGSESTPATNAKVLIEGETVRVEADKPGQGIDKTKLANLIKQSIASGDTQASISQGTTQAAVSTDEATVMAESVRKTLTLPITVTVSGKTFTPNATELGKWLVVSPVEGKLTLQTNQEAINAYIASIAAQVDVKAVNKQINMVNGVVRTVSEGKNGSALDRTGLLASLSKAVTTSTDTAITGSMNTVAFKNITNNTVDLEGKYIEVNLSRQHLWAYDNKQLVYDTPITSGATGAGFATIQGLFSIKAKQTNRNLNGYAIGYNYNVFVNYWMPFSGNYGMHDASWRTSFGGSDYYYGGSHGCVNLPAAAAAWVFNFVNVGTPVWVHS